MKKLPIWKLLIERNIFDNRKTASSWIMMGNVFVNNQRVSKAGDKVPLDANIFIKGLDQKYASRGGYKLEGALKDFGIDVTGRIAIDSGASTGGFTDCLLQHGVSRVYAVDVGFGQLMGKLRSDPRVVNLEKVNISDVKVGDLDPRPDLATIDLSYLSLKKAIPIFRNLLENDGEMLCLIKPLFEIHDSRACRNGRIESVDDFLDILRELVTYTNDMGLKTQGITNSPIVGSNGTREFFMWVSLSSKAEVSTSIEFQIINAVERAMEITGEERIV